MHPSIWSATANPASQFPALSGDHRTDVAVIGAGYTGLSCALALAEAGASVIVVDAEQPGFGASGRNGGQVIPGLKYDPDTLDRRFGEATTDFVGKAADHVFEVIEKHRIACDPRRKGWIQTTVKTSHIATLQSRMEQWVRRGTAAEWLDAEAVARQTGASGFVSGWKDLRAGCVHPLNYAMGLAEAVSRAGGRVHGNSAVSGIKRDGGRWTVSVGAQGHITCDQVVLATNGYSGHLWPGLRQTMVPANSFQVATTPLPDEVSRTILPQGAVVSDTRRLANYFRIGPGNRLMVGGRGHFAEPGGSRTSVSHAAGSETGIHLVRPRRDDAGSSAACLPPPRPASLPRWGITVAALPLAAHWAPQLGGIWRHHPFPCRCRWTRSKSCPCTGCTRSTEQPRSGTSACATRLSVKLHAVPAAMTGAAF